MKTSQYLRFIPNKPVIFTYSGTDELPTVLVLKLLHDEVNPGFLGINLNYIIIPGDKTNVIKEYGEAYYLHSFGETPLEVVLHTKTQIKCAHAIRRYNYDKIGKFIYRGARQHHAN